MKKLGYNSGIGSPADLAKGRLRNQHIETVNDQLKNLCQIEHSHHRNPFNCLVNWVSGLIAYAYHPDKPSLGIPNDELKVLPQAAFWLSNSGWPRRN